MSLALGTAVDALAGKIAAIFHSHVGWKLVGERWSRISLDRSVCGGHGEMGVLYTRDV